MMMPPNKYDFDLDLMTPRGCLKVFLRAILFLFFLLLLLWIMPHLL